MEKIPLKNIEDYVHVLNDTAKIVIVMLDKKANILYVNRYIEELTGYEREKLLGKNWIETFIPSIYNEEIDNVFQDIIENKNMHWGNENEIVCKDNSKCMLSWNNSLCFDENGKFEAVLSVGTDITPIKKIQKDLEKQISSLETEQKQKNYLVNQVNSIIIETNGKKALSANNKLIEFFGLENLEEFQKVYGCICHTFIAHPEFFHLGVVPEGENWIETLYKLPKAKQVVSMISNNNEICAFQVNFSPYIDEKRVIVSFDDITHVLLQSKEFEYKAKHDQLTKINNRLGFYEEYKSIKKRDTKEDFSLIMLDIDHFKKINDEYGHNIGDQVLQDLTYNIKKMLRKEDVFARWGGEEFIVLLPHTTVQEAFLRAEDIRKKVEHSQRKYTPQITISLGVTQAKKEDKTREYFQRVDKALYQAKNEGRNRSVVL